MVFGNHGLLDITDQLVAANHLEKNGISKGVWYSIK
jgi:hypothetical protein